MRQDHAEVVRLYLAVRRAGLARRRRRDLGQQPARRIASRQVNQELVLGRLAPHTCQGFVVLCAALAAPGEAHARLRHQIAFVRAIGEHPRDILFAVFHGNRLHPRSGLAHAIALSQPAMKQHRDAGLPQHFSEEGLGNMRLRQPRDVLQVLRQVVSNPGAPVEFQCVSTDDLAPPDVRTRKSTRHHAAHVIARLQQRDLEPHPCAADGRDRPARGAAVGHQIVHVLAPCRRCKRKSKSDARRRHADYGIRVSARR